MNEYPFLYTIGSHLNDVSAVLDNLISSLDGEGTPCGVLKAVHERVNATIDLALNRLSIIGVAAQDGSKAAS